MYINKPPKGFVFVVDSDSYPVHRDRLFCGVKNPKKHSTRNNGENFNSSFFALYADFLSLREGDFVIFYQMRIDEKKDERGFRGIFKVKGKPFFDDEDILGKGENTDFIFSCDKKVLGKCPECDSSLSEIIPDSKKKRERICASCERKVDFHILPNRVLLENVNLYKDNNKEAVIDDNTAYIDRNYIKDNLPILWTMLFRKTSGAGRARSINPILPEELYKLMHIFDSKFEKLENYKFKPYIKPDSAVDLEIPLETSEEGNLKIEALLEAWIMKNLDTAPDVLKDYITYNDLEYFANNFPYGIGGEKVDILTIHKNNTISRDKANVIELKRDNLKKEDLDQVLDYTKWMSQMIFGCDNSISKGKIQPILIGFKTTERFLKYAKQLKFETRRPIILEYYIANNTVNFKKIKY